MFNPSTPKNVLSSENGQKVGPLQGLLMTSKFEKMSFNVFLRVRLATKSLKFWIQILSSTETFEVWKDAKKI